MLFKYLIPAVSLVAAAILWTKIKEVKLGKLTTRFVSTVVIYVIFLTRTKSLARYMGVADLSVWFWVVVLAVAASALLYFVLAFAKGWRHEFDEFMKSNRPALWVATLASIAALTVFTNHTWLPLILVIVPIVPEAIDLFVGTRNHR
jgi:hypothetical protein